MCKQIEGTEKYLRFQPSVGGHVEKRSCRKERLEQREKQETGSASKETYWTRRMRSKTEWGMMNVELVYMCECDAKIMAFLWFM